MTVTAPVSIESIAQSLVAYCRKGQWEDAHNALYDQNAVSVEPKCHENPETQGLAAILEKSRAWSANTEVHSMTVSEPLVGGNAFALTFAMDATCKLSNQRFQMTELAVYTVQNGKITREEFFYEMNCG